MEQYTHPKWKRDGMRPSAHMVREQVLLGDWQEVIDINAQTIKPDLAPEKLNGLIIKGYEMKFGQTNENGERYDTTAFDKFIQRYFVEGKMNMPVDVNHMGEYSKYGYCGRVLYIEVNTTGFYFVVYIPRFVDVEKPELGEFPYYRELYGKLKNGIIQGFSKEGFVDFGNSEYVWNADDTFAYEQIHEISVLSVSLVCTPANGLPFEKMQETKNALAFKNKLKEEEPLKREDF